MRTIHLNIKSLAMVLAIVTVFMIGFIYYTNTNASPLFSGSESHQIQPPRDTQFRHEAENFERVKGTANITGTENRRKKVVEMIRHAWQGYRNFTFGANELRPLSKSAHNQNIFGGEKMMATIADGADTLWIAGLMDEYNEARNYIRDNFDIYKATSSFSVFEVTIRHVGGFLALYALTKENFYLEKSKSIVDALLPAFNTPTGIPKSLMDLRTREGLNYAWAFSSSILSEIGSLHLEFKYLSHLTKNDLYLQKVEKLRDVLDKVEKKDGLYSNYISPETGEFIRRDVSIGAMGDSFYEYLLKEWIQSNKTDAASIRMYKQASEALRKRLSFKSKDGFTYIAEIRLGVVEHKMGHLACFAPGMFALEAELENDPEQKAEIMSFAEELGRTCHAFYEKTTTGIGPEMVYFDNGILTIRKTENGFVLRPEAIEGWFYLWRITKKELYKEWVWNAIVAIDKYCRVEHGYVGLDNVNNPEQGFDNVQQTFLIAETLKYAYLTFADEILPLNKWVFNTEAHALPIL